MRHRRSSCFAHRLQLVGLGGAARYRVLRLRAWPTRRVPFTLEVENATAKVGEPTAVRATIAPPEGMKLSSVYRHRLIDLSVYEDRGVEFDDEVVIGTVQDDGAWCSRSASRRPSPASTRSTA